MAGKALATGARYQQWRLALLSAIFAASAIGLLYRVYTYQVVDYQRYQSLAQDEHDFKKEIVPRRGDILDRTGNPLAVSVMYQSLYAYPPRVKDINGTAEKLAPLLGETKDSIVSDLQSSKSVVLLKSKLPADVSTKIASLGLPGTILMEEPFRGYPEGNIAPQILGFVGKDFQGLAGLELSLDRDLRGVPGVLNAERDTSGDVIAIGKTVEVPPKDGSDAILTIDRYIQRMAEQQLAEGIKKYKAKGGFIIIMDPKTGGILAAATQPTYDLTADEIYDPSKESLYKSTIATDAYEPGSVMKLVTMSGGLEEKLITPDTAIIDNGSVMVDGVRIHNWDYSGPGRETMTQVLINSANVGAQYVSGLLGPERFYHYVNAFGFGQVTGIELPGESSGHVRTPSDPAWTRIDLATNAFGQGIAVTPLQMITAVAAIANGGVLPKPMIVKAYRDGNSMREVPPVMVRRVISPETAKTLTGMMIHVVEDNSLKLSVVPGYKIAGKTGTADLPIATGYNLASTYASMIGFAPAYDPKWLMLIRIDDAPALYGGQTASPMFKLVAEKLFNYMGIPPTEPVPPRPAPTEVSKLATPSAPAAPAKPAATTAPAKPAATPAPAGNVRTVPKEPAATNVPSTTTTVHPTVTTVHPTITSPSPTVGPTRPVAPTKPVSTPVPTRTR
ncbi:MAG: penicillin-binding protein 2 [Chloroflexi bacterium]|nr:penicillin-binding protein 2 [Chloroflexota bacterium]